ncbi:hypothetical protein F53441_2899 [Fusarium austroafricanum]|uniref:Uncharacterized protein n=1 Tax=Fusarium austroafricanum TaxID=2364996 RepID=A0A8H4KSR9_9HYPO|nr:hypothetical protein F53441_2899 [Fusarium austroafricanum]
MLAAIGLADDLTIQLPLPEESLNRVLNDFQDGIEQAAREKAVDRFSIDDDDVTYTPGAASEAAEGKLRSLVTEAIRPYLMQSHRVNNLLDKSKALDRFREDSPYIVSISESVKKRDEFEQARKMDEKTAAAQNLANADITTSKANIDTEGTNLAIRDKEL